MLYAAFNAASVLASILLFRELSSYTQFARFGIIFAIGLILMLKGGIMLRPSEEITFTKKETMRKEVD